MVNYQMGLAIRKITAKSILTRSGISGIDYCVNPYVGCSHGCAYCYATFMKRFNGHTEAWGTFLDVKVDAPDVLRRQLRHTARGSVMISSVTDPYQPAEKEYHLTRTCLETLLDYQYPVDILTKSSLVLRDMDLFKQFRNISVGITVTTDDDTVRKVFEPHAPSVRTRIDALKSLHENGIATYVFIGPVLPMNPEVLSESLYSYVDSVLIDRMNYVAKTRNIYKQMKFDRWLQKDVIENSIMRLRKGLSGKNIRLC
jgi:DNA repair photolyase